MFVYGTLFLINHQKKKETHRCNNKSKGQANVNQRNNNELQKKNAVFFFF